MLKNATRCHLLSALDFCERIAPITKSKLSVFIQKRAEVSDKTRIETEVITALRELKVSCCKVVHVHILLAPVRSKKEQAMSKRLWINH